jgi:hypothetical protein
MGNNSDKVKKRIEELSAYIQGVSEQCEQNEDASDVSRFLAEIQEELTRLRRAFNTRRFFVVTIGALKAGKSTLVNALTGYKVSPAGTGAETTKKCSIIMSADEEHPEGITLYRYRDVPSNPELGKKGKNDTCEKATRKLMDYLKGICDWEGELKNFDRKPIALRARNIDPFNGMDNLEYILTSPDLSGLQQFRDYLLAEIRIQTDPAKESVLRQNVAIIDMPGLDGTLAGVDSSDVNPVGNPVNFIPKFCHLFLLVQSSISGLNRTTASKLNEWQAGKRNTPVYLVFNEINSKSGWRNDQSLKEEGKKSQERALAELRQQKVFYRDCYKVNAAKAWESCQKDEYSQYWQTGVSFESLRKASAIDVLMDALKKDFAEQKDRIIQEDAVNGVNNALNCFIEKANRLKEEASNNRKALNDERDVWGDIMSCIDRGNSEIKRDNLQSIICTALGKKMSETEQKVRDAIEEGEKYGWEDEKKSMYDQIVKFAVKIRDALQRAHIAQGFIEELNEVMKTEFENYYSKVNKKLDDLKYEKPSTGRYVDEVKSEIRSFSAWKDATTELKEQFKSIPIDPVTRVDKEELTNFWTRPWTKKGLISYKEKYISKYENDLKKYLESEFKMRLTQFCVTEGAHDDCLFNRRVNAVKACLEEKKSKSLARVEKSIRQYSEIINLIPELITQIGYLEQSCKDFENSIS